MDKELLRVVIIAFGLIVVVGMLAWHFFKNKKSFQGMMSSGNQEFKGKINEAIVVHSEHNDFEIVPKGKKLIDTSELLERFKPKAKPKPASPEIKSPPQVPVAMFGDFDEDFDLDGGDSFLAGGEDDGGIRTPKQKDAPLADVSEEIPEGLFEEPPEEEMPVEPRFAAPDIIQFRVIAKADQGFNGLDMLRAFRIAQLEYSDLKTFERYDANRLVDFGVACMVGSGTFPDHGFDEFYTPGLVFFMQPALLDDAVRVFDDFLEAINIVAVELDGTLLDHEKKPLTNATIKMIRQSL